MLNCFSRDAKIITSYIAIIVTFGSGTFGFLSGSKYESHQLFLKNRQCDVLRGSFSAALRSAVSEEEQPRSSTSPQQLPFEWTKQWYPIIPLSYVEEASKPIPMTILNQDIVIWKTSEGEFSVLDDSCPHRRAPLSTGKVVNDGKSLACRYHGWEFSAGGSCEKIPMMQPGQSTSSKAFCVKSYHTQPYNGFLFVYMDPTDPSPPPLPKDVASPDAGMWIFNVNPVSYHSMIENSFDPSHAPFTHEGQNRFASMSPKNAIPMEKYNLVEEVSSSGFTVEHSPYQTNPMAPPDAPDIMTTRTFLPPCTSVVNSFINTELHFVPCTPTETLTLGKFMAPPKPKGKFGSLMENKRLKPLKELLSDSVHFGFQISDGVYRFASQDRLIMQAQDSRKVQDGKWDDLYPTASDAGVATMQRWMKKYGNSGPFPLHSLQQPQKNRELSVWDSHAKFCPQCKRSITRVGKLDRLSRKISKAALLLSGILATVIVRVDASRSLFVAASAVSLILSVGARFLSQWCQRILEKTFATGIVQKKKMMEIFAY